MKNKQSRGYITDKDLKSAKTKDSSTLLKQVVSPKPVERSIAIRLLAQRKDIDYLTFIELLLKQLVIEQALYTRLEITAVLEKTNKEALNKIITYLGKIGNNQHTNIDMIITSKKKSYPLARDIIARTLAKTNPEYIDDFFEILETGSVQQQREIIDSIGYMIFYNANLATCVRFQKIIAKLSKTNDIIIKWKLLTCLSAFKTIECINFLTNYLTTETNKILLQEAQRSLNIIEKKT